jgi:hypothetical protein
MERLNIPQAVKDNIRIVEEYYEALNAHDFLRMRVHHSEGFGSWPLVFPARSIVKETRPTSDRGSLPFQT